MRRLLLAATVVALALPATAGAHPLGNFTVNQYARIQVAPTGVDIRFVLDQAEIPTLQMVQAHDRDGSGRLEGAELTAVRDQLARDITGRIALTVGGRPARLAVTGATLALPRGQGGLATTRLDLALHADGVRLSGTPEQLAYRSGYAADRVRVPPQVLRRAVSAGKRRPGGATSGVLSTSQGVSSVSAN